MSIASIASESPTDSPSDVTIMTIERTPGRRVVIGAVIGPLAGAQPDRCADRPDDIVGGGDQCGPKPIEIDLVAQLSANASTTFCPS